MSTQGIDIIIANLNELKNKAKEQLQEVAKEVMEIIYLEVFKNCNLDDHTLKELARLGHPYALHEGTYSDIKGHRLNVKAIHEYNLHPAYMIHKQSGHLQQNIKKLIVLDEAKITIKVGISEEDVPYIAYLINGTSKMIPRPLFEYINRVYMPEWKEKFIKAIKYGLASKISSKQGSTYSRGNK